MTKIGKWWLLRGEGSLEATSRQLAVFFYFCDGYADVDFIIILYTVHTVFVANYA